MTDPEDPCLEALGDLLPRVLHLLSMLEFAQRYLHPPVLPALASQLAPLAAELSEAVTRFTAPSWPAPLQSLRDRVLEAATLASGACAGLEDATPEDVPRAYRALRRATHAQEALWPLAAVLPPVSRFFLERALHEAAAAELLGRLELEAAAPRPGRGLFHTDNDRTQRGGWSAYVPEGVADAEPMPLVMALHGGSGHGRDFLFAWLREARTRGCVLVAPTSPQHTWSFPGLAAPGVDDTDAHRLFELVTRLRELLPIDASRMLLTGMSDGGSYALMSGLREASPFTALAPFSCVLAPEVMLDGRIARARDLPIRWVHGALDWMFPPERAREGVLALEGAGARVDYVELEDLSHCHAREECARVLDWMGVPRPGA
ncbi:MAG: hypothetical protein V2J24_08675 [Pseudomonadales bacterium]|nr:hypothetical protein [Pseudomonadales bacterium]